MWQGPPKIKHSVLVKEYSEGGLKMTDLLSYIKSLKLTWLRRLIIFENRCFNILSSLFNFEKLCNCGKEYTDIVARQLKNDFWKDVLNAYSSFISCISVNSIYDFLEMPLFYNHNLLIDRKPIFFKTMVR